MKRGLLKIFSAVALLTALALIYIAWNERDSDPAGSSSSPTTNTADLQARGAYLARAGNCAGCHTAQGGPPYAGGRELPTPFGTFVTPNITADRSTGIGSWSAQDFWRALHHGKGRDGKLLYPAFPYTEYTRVSRADSDALFSYLQTIAPVAQVAAADRLQFPYNIRALLYVWRALYFKPGTYEPVANQTAEWNRGAYLVQGLGHCNACHSTRNALGAAGGAALGGGQVAGRSWYAPSLTARAEAGNGDVSVDEIVSLLSTGRSSKYAASGPMAEVIGQSLQHLSATDVRAMAVYLKSLPDTSTQAPAPAELTADATQRIAKGGQIYELHCKDCHGASGEGAANAYPPLAGNRSVTLPLALNTIRSVLDGGFAPSTIGNPRPYGMPPFAHVLSSDEVAQVVSYVRNSWGNRASLVNAIEVDRSGSD
ncbi:MAG: cytochrome c [Betaproteobacteria bacterium]